MPLNEAPGLIIQVPCVCGSRASCVKCGGSGALEKLACRRCGGTGSETRINGLPPKCADCRGQGWRELDNETREKEWGGE